MNYRINASRLSIIIVTLAISVAAQSWNPLFAQTQPVTFDKPGDFFTPTPANPTLQQVNFNVPNTSVFVKAIVELDVTHAGWYAAKPGGFHNLFWFSRGGIYQSSTIGYMNMKGPGTNGNKITQMTNLTLAQGVTIRKTFNYQAVSGTKYHIK